MDHGTNYHPRYSQHTDYSDPAGFSFDPTSRLHQYKSIDTLSFRHCCSYMMYFCSCVRRVTKEGNTMFNPNLCNRMAENKTGVRYSGACCSATGATTARSGAVRAWNEPPRGTSLTSTSATSKRAGSRSRASARSTPSAGRWAYRLRSGLMSPWRTKATELGKEVFQGGVSLGT